MLNNRQKSSSKYVILGGGPSGLGVAWGLLEQGVTDITIIEKAPRLGGLCGSFDFFGNTLDFGPHRFSPEFPALCQRFKNLLKENWLEVENNHAVYFRNRFYYYPPKLSDFLNKDSITFSAEVFRTLLKDKFTLPMFDIPNTFSKKIRQRFGSTLFDEVVFPLCEKVWGDPNELTPSFADLRFSVPTFRSWAERFFEEKEARDKVFYYPRKGFQQLWDGLENEFVSRGIQILKNSFVTQMGCEDGKIRHLTLNRNGHQDLMQCDTVISTIPSEDLISLLYRDHSFQAPKRGMLLFNILIRRPRVLPARVLIFPEAHFSFSRLSEQNQFSKDTVQTGYSVVQADHLTSVGSPTWERSSEDWFKELFNQLQPTGLFKETEVIQKNILRVPVAYPIPSYARESMQRKFDSYLADFKNLFWMGRFASSDYNNSHTALMKGFKLSRYLVGKTSQKQWVEESLKLSQLPIRD